MEDRIFIKLVVLASKLFCIFGECMGSSSSLSVFCTRTWFALWCW